jgi:hypothetical protein
LIRALKNISNLLLLIAALTATQGCDVIGSSLTNEDAIRAANRLSEKLNINFTYKLRVKSTPIFLTLFVGDDAKNAKMIVSTNNDRLVAMVGRKNKEVTNLTNPEAMERVLDKLGPEFRKTWPPFWKKDKPELFIDENQAKSILHELSNRIGLPSDIESPVISLNKDYGLWTAKWQRKYNGYLFDKDYISISINAVSGEFEGYTKSFNAEPCPTEVKTDKNMAIETAYKKFTNYFPSDEWEKNKDKFELVSAELRIVKPDEHWQRLLPFFNAKSRLAWVVVFDVKKGQETETIGVLNKDKSVICVDAASNKILTSEINAVI